MKGKNIVVGISGGIAAYKAAELVRLLMKSEALTNVAMTTNAAQFVTPVTFEALSGNRLRLHMKGLQNPCDTSRRLTPRIRKHLHVGRILQSP